MKQLSNASVAILCRVLPILIGKCRDDGDLRIRNAARMASVVLRRLRKLNGDT